MTLERKGLESYLPFRWRRLGEGWLLVAEGGAFVVLDAAAFTRLFEQGLEAGSPEDGKLVEAGFARREGWLEELAGKASRRLEFLKAGPILHIVILTLRCNQICSYCHASRRPLGDSGYDMSIETASKVLDVILSAPCGDLTIEFQGGEPLLAWDTLKFFVEEGVKRGAEVGKRLQFSLVSNLSPMDEEKLKYLLENNIQVCTSIDGPADLHDLHRKHTGGSHQAAVQWMQAIDEGWKAGGLDPVLYHVEALPTITRDSLSRGKEIVDEYVRLGRKALFLRPLNPFGFARTFPGYTAREFVEFYRSTLDYILQLNRGGVEILERTAAIFLTKILAGEDPNFLDLRAPCGAGIGQITYNHDGRVYTCDEGRMLASMGDPAFCIGGLADAPDSYSQIISHDTVQTLALASTLDGLPGCNDCAFRDFCGVCPVYSYREHGTVFGIHSDSERCRIYSGILSLLFELLAGADNALLDIFGRWITVRRRDAFFIHDGRLGCSR